MQNKTKISISKNIIALRKKTGETQLQLAEALGISNRTVSKWENGESEPELQYIIAIAEHYNVRLEELIYENIPCDLLDKPKISLRTAVITLFEKQKQCIFDFLNQRYVCLTEEKNIPLIMPCGVSQKNSADYTEIHTSEVFFHVHSSADAAYSIALMQNENQYEWLESNAERLSEIFCLLSQPGMMRLIRFLHMHGTSEQITMQYISKQTGCEIKHIQRFFELLRTENHDIETLNGIQKVYTFQGNGHLMAMLTMIYEAFLDNAGKGTQVWNGVYKPIFPKEKE